MPVNNWCDFLCKKVSTKRTKRTKGPLTQVSAGWGVRLKRLMRLKSPFQVGSGGKTAFPQVEDSLPPGAGPVSGQL